MADDAIPTTPVTKPKDRWKQRDNPDWVSGWKDEEKKDLDEYCAMLRADPRARTPGRTEDGGVKLQKGTTMAVPRRGGSGRFIEARQSDTTLLTIAKGRSVRSAMETIRVKSRQRSRAGSRARRRTFSGVPSEVLTVTKPSVSGEPTPAANAFREKTGLTSTEKAKAGEEQLTPDEKRLQRIARMEEKAAKALEKKPRRPAGEPPPKKQKKPSPPKPSKIKALANFFTPVKKAEEVVVDRPATAESSKRVSFTPDTKTRESSRAPSRAEKKVVPPGSNTQGGSWKFSDVPTIEHKQISPSPEKPMPRIIMPDVGVRCRTINYDEVLDVQEALDQRRNLSVREQLQNRIIRDHDPRLAEKKRLTVAKPPPVTNNDFTEALRFARRPFAFLASRRWRGG
jgi:hypothetical protein